MRIFALTFLVAACDPGGGDRSNEASALSSACMAGAPGAHACDPADTKKTTICHIPPGNPANEHTLCVGNAAVPAHLAHGDHVGACDAECGPDGGATTGTTGSGGTTGVDTTGSTSGGTTGAATTGTTGGTSGGTTGDGVPF
jgi:hypothetical protein